MISINLTNEELWAVTFAVKADLETVEGEPDEFGDDAHSLRTALAKLEQAEQELDENG